MSDLHLRELQRKYFSSGSPRDFQNLIAYEARAFGAVELFHAVPVLPPNSIPMLPIHMTISLFDDYADEEVWYDWGLDITRRGDVEHLTQVMSEVFSDAKLPWPHPAIQEIIAYGENFFFMYLQPEISRQEAASLCEALNELTKPIVSANAGQNIDNAAAAKVIEGYQYTMGLVNFLTTNDSPLWEYPSSTNSLSITAFLEPNEIKILNAIKRALYSSSEMRQILQGMVEGYYMVTCNNKPLQKEINNLLTFIQNFDTDTPQQERTYISSIIFDVNSWINPHTRATTTESMGEYGYDSLLITSIFSASLVGISGSSAVTVDVHARVYLYNATVATAIEDPTAQHEMVRLTVEDINNINIENLSAAITFPPNYEPTFALTLPRELYPPVVTALGETGWINED